MVAPVRGPDQGERVLLARLVAGDDSALAEVYDRFASLVHGIARRTTCDDRAAEDVTQEVFVSLWSDPGRVDLERSSLAGWLSVLAHRRAVDHVRRTERARAREEREARSAALELEGPDPAEGMVTADLGRRARQAVAALPPDQRAVVELVFWGGRSYRQAAEELGIPEGTAKSRARLALAKLADALASLDPERLR